MVLFIASLLYHKRHITVHHFGYVPLMFWGRRFFTAPRFFSLFYFPPSIAGRPGEVQLTHKFRLPISRRLSTRLLGASLIFCRPKSHQKTAEGGRAKVVRFQYARPPSGTPCLSVNLRQIGTLYMVLCFGFIACRKVIGNKLSIYVVFFG